MPGADGDQACGAITQHLAQFDHIKSEQGDPVDESAEGPHSPRSLPHSGRLNAVISVAVELSHRGVPDLWFSCHPGRRREIEAAATGSPIGFIPFDCGPSRSEVDDFVLDEKKVHPTHSPTTRTISQLGISSGLPHRPQPGHRISDYGRRKPRDATLRHDQPACFNPHHTQTSDTGQPSSLAITHEVVRPRRW
ncbi:hypothetical protein [Streptomyces sp. NPDC092952]|uniref:hypothetical protein n=1 Tax=Streptomyces sp. NPDC092952 TaxID=3366018 RepID=UPI00382A0F9D